MHLEIVICVSCELDLKKNSAQHSKPAPARGPLGRRFEGQTLGRSSSICPWPSLSSARAGYSHALCPPAAHCRGPLGGPVGPVPSALFWVLVTGPPGSPRTRLVLAPLPSVSPHGADHPIPFHTLVNGPFTKYSSHLLECHLFPQH